MMNIFKEFTITTRATINSFSKTIYKSLLNISSEILFTVFLIAFVNSSVVVGFSE